MFHAIKTSENGMAMQQAPWVIVQLRGPAFSMFLFLQKTALHLTDIEDGEKCLRIYVVG